MTDSLISLISIFVGIVGANFFGIFFKKYSLGKVGNTIAGVFGSIFFIKSLGRLGFSPKFIIQSESVNLNLFVLNSLISFLGGAVAVFLIFKLKNKMNNNS